MEKGSLYWKNLAKYGLEQKLLMTKEVGILEIACNIPNKIPSERQSKILIETEKRLKKEGFTSI